MKIITNIRKKNSRELSIPHSLSHPLLPPNKPPIKAPPIYTFYLGESKGYNNRI